MKAFLIFGVVVLLAVGCNTLMRLRWDGTLVEEDHRPADPRCMPHFQLPPSECQDLLVSQAKDRGDTLATAQLDAEDAKRLYQQSLAELRRGEQ